MEGCIYLYDPESASQRGASLQMEAMLYNGILGSSNVLNVIMASSIKCHRLAFLMHHYAYRCSFEQFLLSLIQRQKRENSCALLTPSASWRKAGQTQVSLAHSANGRGLLNNYKLLPVTCSKENSSKNERKQKIRHIYSEAAVARTCVIACILYGKMWVFEGWAWSAFMLHITTAMDFYRGKCLGLNLHIAVLVYLRFLPIWITGNFFLCKIHVIFFNMIR